MKKLVSLVLALAMIMMVGAAFAATTSNGSISVTNAEIGADYALYKLFDATVAADGTTAYMTSKDVSSDTFFNTYFTIGNGGYITPKAAFTSEVLKSDTFKTWAAGFGTKIGDTKKADSQTVSWTGLEYGYYYVTSTVGAVLTVDEVNPNASVIDKNQHNESDKKIVEGSNKVALNEAGINEDVNFELTETVRNFDGSEKIYRYQIDDQLDPAFAYNKTSLIVKVNGNSLGASNYSVTWDDDTPAFTILIPWTDNDAYDGAHLYDNNSTIVVTYSAKLDPDKIETAPSNLNVGNVPNKNIAQLKWFKGSDNPTTPNGELPENKTDTYDTALTIIKHDGQNNILTGAQFTLTSTNGTKVILVTENYYEADAAGTHWKLKDGTYTTEAPNGNATHDGLYDSTEIKYLLKTRQVVKGEGRTDTSVSSFVGDDGTVTFTGLAVGHYKIEETVVPAGYNKAADIEFDISFNPETKKFASSNNAVVLNDVSNVFSTTVINQSGTELPHTGGIGTTIFYILGGPLVIGADVILVARRKAQD